MSAIRPRSVRRLGALAAVSAIALVGASAAGAGADSGSGGNVYRQTNLVSDINGVARIADPNLVNPWGMAAGPQTPLWVADNGKDVSTLYSGGVGGSIPAIVPLVVDIPGGAPTGIVFNPTSGFVVHSGSTSAPARFIFDSEAGQIAAWTLTTPPATRAETEVTTPGAVYKGLAIAGTAKGTFLYAANFHAGTIDVFDDAFKPAHLAGSFHDDQLPAGYAPFNIQELGGRLYVSYAKQDAAAKDDVPGAGNGFVDVFDTSGNLVKRLIAHGELNAPWGLVLAPKHFGAFGRDLLVGNFGDGTINAYDPQTGAFRGKLSNEDGNPIRIDGLWALRFGNGVFGTPRTLVFTAGIGDEAHGLLGEIAARRSSD